MRRDGWRGGFTVLNPAVLPDGLAPEQYMPICMAMLEQAEGIYLLEGWEDSPGARLEWQYALYQGKTVYYEGRENAAAAGD